MKFATGRRYLASTFGCFLAASISSAAWAHSPTGAIFTTVADGTEVNANIYASKDDVYLDGGPGPGAPQTAAGLNDDTYVFQVTDPSGKKLLSQDPARCRQFVVTNGIITSLVPSSCQHLTGLDVDHGALTVQLMPYADTPNNGGEYKAWVVSVSDFLAGCAALGVSNGLDVVDCGQAPGNQHGFVPRHTKTDNFKVGNTNNLEIDTRFFDAATGATLSGQGVTWTDTLGGSNRKWSYNNPSWSTRDNLSHVEAVEAGTHQIDIQDQAGCTVVRIYCEAASCGHVIELAGAGTILVPIKVNERTWTHHIEVSCIAQ